MGRVIFCIKLGLWMTDVAEARPLALKPMPAKSGNEMLKLASKPNPRPAKSGFESWSWLWSHVWWMMHNIFATGMITVTFRPQQICVISGLDWAYPAFLWIVVSSLLRAQSSLLLLLISQSVSLRPWPGCLYIPFFTNRAYIVGLCLCIFFFSFFINFTVPGFV